MISIDPGESCFWASWNPQGRLVSCGPWPCYEILPGECAVIEEQVIIPKFTRDPASIITLAHLAGAIAHEFGWPSQDRVKWVRPRTWKQNTKKPRYARQWASYAIHRLNIQSMDSEEISIYTVALAALPEGQRHDLADAVGIGLWELGRLAAPRTVSPRKAERAAALAETLRRQAG